MWVTQLLLSVTDSVQRSSYNCHKGPLNDLGTLTARPRPRPSHGVSCLDSHNCGETCQLLWAPLLQMTVADNK